MKTKNILLLTLGLLISGLTQAQNNELNSAPPTQSQVIEKSVSEPATGTISTTQPTLSRKPQYSLSAGSMFSRFGGASYIQPSVLFPVTNRFTAFGGVSIVNNYLSSMSRNVLENTFPGAGNANTINYIVTAGGHYLINNRLSLTGSAWRDFSKNNYLPNTPINVFSPNGGTSGMQFRANYKITENLSVSGGFRYSNGNQFNSLYQNDFIPGGF